MLTIRLDSKLEKELTDEAQAEGVTKSELIRRIVKTYLSQQEKQTAWDLGKDIFGKYDLENSHLSRDRKSIVSQRINQKAVKSSRCGKQ